MRANVMLCEAAQVTQGKLYVLGGGIDLLPAGQMLSYAVVVTLKVAWLGMPQRRRFAVVIEDADGQPVPGLPGSSETPALEITVEDLKAHDLIPIGADMTHHLALTINGIGHAVGRYRWKVAVDSMADEEWTAPFTVADPAAMP